MDSNLLLNRIVIKSLTESDIPRIVLTFNDLGWNKPVSLFKGYLEDQNNRTRIVWTVWFESEFVGYNTLKLNSDYLPFKEHKIPEINDLNVVPKYRKNGIGSKLLDCAENEARRLSEVIGLGVGLLSDYGNAQRLYIERGYLPNGLGLTYKNNNLKWGDKVVADDDLVLWFTKKLG